MTEPPRCPLAFVGCETTGAHPGGLPWEVAVIRRDTTGTTLVLQHVEDLDLSTADPWALAINGFYDRYWLYAPGDCDAQLAREHQVALDVERLTRRACLVGVGVHARAETFAALLRRHRLVPAWYPQVIDVVTLAAGFLAARGVVAALPWDPGALSRACRVTPPEVAQRHTALGAAQWAQQWVDAIMAPAEGAAEEQP